MPSFRLVVSVRTDPYWNLAAEEWLLDQAAQADPVCFLWQSDPAVIVGKNQNPWRECRVPWMGETGIRLARRISGGGAVYHDGGNLNFAFVLPRADYQTEALFRLVQDVLADLGFASQRLHRTGLAVDGYKVSGNAFCFRRKAALHHGTLLIDANLEQLRHALTPPSWTFATRATSSIPAPVRNLRSWKPALTVAQVKAAFAAHCGGDLHAFSWPEASLAARAAERAGDDWLFGLTPPFVTEGCLDEHGARHRWSVAVDRGIITRMDPADGNTTSDKPADWIGRPFNEFVHVNRLSSGT